MINKIFGSLLIVAILVPAICMVLGTFTILAVIETKLKPDCSVEEVENETSFA